MTRRNGLGGLGRAGKAALIERFANARPLESRGEGRASSKAPSGLGERHARFTDFRTLPGYEELSLQRAAAEVLKIDNPFFRAHDGRAGARTTIDGGPHLNFASYDYLGLNGHPAVHEAARAAIARYGMSASASRLVAGERPVHRELERALAAHYGVEDAVAFVSGHATNVNVIGQITGPQDLIVHDALIHNSVVVGARLSGARRRAFPHNDLGALEAILESERERAERCLIVVEGLYSMDGDSVDLAALVALKERFGAWLMVDEAHALGVVGPTGRGSGEHCGVPGPAVDIWMGTLSKTLAACGGYIAGPAALTDYLKATNPGFVYSVGLAPPVAAAAHAALALAHAEPERVARLQAHGRRFLEGAKARGLDTGTCQGFAVVPVLIGDSIRATRLSAALLKRGINALPIIHPAVPERSARLRFFLTCEHEEEAIDTALDTLAEELERVRAGGLGLAEKARLAARAGLKSGS